MSFQKIALIIVALMPSSTDLNQDMRDTLRLDPPCVRSGQTAYVGCCIATENNNVASWHTSIKHRKTTFKGTGLLNASFVNRTGECEWYSFTTTLNINGTVIYCLRGQVQSNSVTVQVTTGYIDDVQVGNYTSEVHGNNVEFNLTLVPKDTVCPVENPLNYSAVVSRHPSQTGTLQIKNDSGHTVWLLGVTVLYDHIQSLLKLIFSITFHYDQGKSRSILPFVIENPMYTMKNSSKDIGVNPESSNIIAEALGGGIGGGVGAVVVVVVVVAITGAVGIYWKKYRSKQTKDNLKLDSIVVTGGDSPPLAVTSIAGGDGGDANSNKSSTPGTQTVDDVGGAVPDNNSTDAELESGAGDLEHKGDSNVAQVADTTDGMVLSRQGYFPRNGHEPTIAKASKSEEYRPSVSSGRMNRPPATKDKTRQHVTNGSSITPNNSEVTVTKPDTKPTEYDRNDDE